MTTLTTQSDAELVERMALAISGSGVTSAASLRKARAAPSVAKTVIERAALRLAADKIIDLQNDSSDACWNDGLCFALEEILALIPNELETK